MTTTRRPTGEVQFRQLVEWFAATIRLQRQALVHYRRFKLTANLRRKLAELEAAVAEIDVFESSIIRREQRRRARKPRRDDLTKAIAEERQKHPTAKPYRLSRYVLANLRRQGVENLPARTTIYDRLKKNR